MVLYLLRLVSDCGRIMSDWSVTAEAKAIFSHHEENLRSSRTKGLCGMIRGLSSLRPLTTGISVTIARCGIKVPDRNSREVLSEVTSRLILSIYRY